MATISLTLLKLAALSSISAKPILYAPLDGSTRAMLVPYAASTESQGTFESTEGVVGKAVNADVRPLDYDLAGLLTRDQGTVAAWVRVPWDPEVVATHMVFDLGRFGSLRRWQQQLYLTFSLWYHHIDERHDYGCTHPIGEWQPGQWHHLAMAWSWPQKRRAIYCDGQCVKVSPIKRVPNVLTLFRVGPELSGVDEVYVFDEMVSDAEVHRIYESGKAGRPAYDLGPMPPVRKTAGALPDEPRPAKPDFVDWSFDGAWQRDNGLRGEVTLNGWWRWQRAENTFVPPKPGQWLYRKAPALSSYAQSFPLRDDQFHIVPEQDPRTGGTSRLRGAHVWYERELVVPAQWRGRRIVLDIDSIVRGGSIYLNRQLLDFLPTISLGGTYDVTDRVVWGQPNLLTVRCYGIDGDMTLRSLPGRGHIEDAWLRTSYRQKRVDCDLTLTAPKSCSAVVEIVDPSSDAVVKRLRTDVSADRATVGDSWLPNRLWSLEEPNLYEFRVKLIDSAGRVVDQTFPKRFGFRELWIERDQFLLNGVPTYFIGHSNAHTTRTSEVGCGEYLRYSFERWRAAGLNCVTPWQGFGRNPTFSHLLNVTDEMGMAIFIVGGVPSFERVKYLSEETKHQYEAYYRRYITRYRQHPSLLGWMIGGGSHVFDFCPAVMDNSFDPESVPGWDRPKKLRKGWKLADKHDPTRVKFGLSEGNIGPIWTSMAYQGFDVELRERRNWPWAWSKVRHKPLMPCEFSLPYYRDWFMRTRHRSGKANYAPEGTHTIATEYAAMYFGDQVYSWDDEKYLESLGTTPGSPAAARSYWQTKNLFADTLLSWRTYGMSFIYHAEVPYLFTGQGPTFPTNRKLDPRRPGGAPENLHGSRQATDELSEFGKRVKAATAPVAAYIGGPDREFWYTDHSYFAGETIRKAVVLLNYRGKPLDYRIAWRAIAPDGTAIASDVANGTLRPGARTLEACPIELVAPAVEQRTSIRIQLEVQAHTKLQDEVTLVVFPPTRPRATTGSPVMLFDPVGDTRTMLKGAGVPTEDLADSLSPERCLVIGRHVLESSSHRRRLADAGFDGAVAKGLRALIFEQAASEWEGNLLGLKIRRTATRHAFVRAPQHPCLAGLQPDDFHYFRGDSDLIESHPKPTQVETAYPLHFWHWGNDNIVATYVIEGPQTGAARALLDCGFDLSETPLLEVRRGKGTLIFCQLDVTNRYGIDPVATRLVDNLLEYLSSLKPLHGSAPEPLALAKQIRTQGSVSLYRATAPGIPGIGDSHLFFRERLTLPAFKDDKGTGSLAQTSAKGRSQAVRATQGAGTAKGSLSPSPKALFAQIDGKWATSLSLAKLRTNWQRAKRARIEAALRILNGTPSSDGPQLTLQGDDQTLYPHEWTYVDSMKASFDPYVYWRW